MPGIDATLLAGAAQLLLSAGAALLGAWWGARVAVTRLRRERAFERQLEWQEETTRALYDLSYSLHCAVMFARSRARRSELLNAWDKFLSDLNTYGHLSTKAVMYAERGTALRLVRLLEEMRQIEGNDPPEDAEDAVLWAHIEKFAPIVEAILEAATAVAQAVRKQLGLGPTNSLGFRLRSRWDATFTSRRDPAVSAAGDPTWSGTKR